MFSSNFVISLSGFGCLVFDVMVFIDNDMEEVEWEDFVVKWFVVIFGWNVVEFR